MHQREVVVRTHRDVAAIRLLQVGEDVVNDVRRTTPAAPSRSASGPVGVALGKSAKPETLEVEKKVLKMMTLQDLDEDRDQGAAGEARAVKTKTNVAPDR